MSSILGHTRPESGRSPDGLHIGIMLLISRYFASLAVLRGFICSWHTP